MRRLSIFLLLFVWLGTYCALPQEKKQDKKGPFGVFFAIHLEARELSKGKYQERIWPKLVELVKMADKYKAKLTLMFNPQWAEYILKDKEKFSLVKEWQKNGHEVALHYHNIYHGDWNGYTNREDEKYTDEARYRGKVKEMMKLLKKLAKPEKVLTMCMGPEKEADNHKVIEIDDVDYPDGIIYDIDGFNVGLTKVLRTKYKGRTLLHLKHRIIDRRSFEQIKKDIKRAKRYEVLGVVTHGSDFARNPEFFKKWFEFTKKNNIKIQTVKEIIKRYPEDEIVDVKWITQKEFKRPVARKDIFRKVRRFHKLLREKKAEGVDTSKAEELGKKSRKAAKRGDWKKAEELLDEAIKILEELDKKK
jgi:hypothetical protein